MKSVIEEVLNYPVELIWDVVVNNEDYKWRSDLKSLTIIDENHFMEVDKNNYEVHFEITEKSKYELYMFNVTSQKIYGTWSGEFIRLTDKQTKLIFTEDMETKNLIVKFFLPKFMKKMQKAYMEDLKEKLSTLQ